MILKMETLSRDTQYLKEKLDLNIEVEFGERGGQQKNISSQR